MSLRTKEHRYEVDFAVGDALFTDSLELYQVCVDVHDDQTVTRELRALWEAMREQGMRKSTLIVAEGESKTYEHEDCTVDQVPAWKWFIDTQD